MPPGPPVLATLLAEVYGPDAETRRAVAEELKTIFRSVPFIVDVDDSYGKPRPRLRIAIDQDEIEHFRVEQSDVYDTVQVLFGGVRVGTSHRGAERDPIDIVIGLPKSDLAWSERLAATPVPANTLPGSHTVVELGQVVHATREAGSPVLFRRDGRFADMVTAELAGTFEAPIYGMLAVDKLVAAHDWGKLPRPEIRLRGQPEDEFEAGPVVGRRMGDHLCHLPRHGGRVRRGLARHLRARSRAVPQLPRAAGHPHAGAADADRHRRRALAVWGTVHRDLDDRLHRARRHHRAQFHPAGGFRAAWRGRGEDAAATSCSMPAPSASVRSC